jgi:hypothetical protein
MLSYSQRARLALPLRDWALNLRTIVLCVVSFQSGVRISLEGLTAAAAPTGLVLVLVAYGIAYVAPAEMHWTLAFLI